MNSGMPKLLYNGRKTLFLVIVMLIVGQALAMGGAAIATRKVFNSLHNTAITIPTTALTGLLIAGLLYAGFRVLTLYYSEKLGQSYAIDFRKNFYTHLSRSPISVLAERRVGALSIRFVGDLSAMRDWVSKGVTGIVSGCIILPVALATLYILNKHYLLLVFVPIIVSLIIMVVVGLRLRPIHQKLRSERANLAIDMMERVPAAPALRLLGRAAADIKLLKKRGDRLLDAASQRASHLESLRALPDIAMSISGVLLLWSTASSGGDAASAAAGLAVLGLIAVPLRDLGTAWDLHCSWEIARDKSEVVFNRPTLDRSTEGDKLKSRPLSITAHDIAVDDIEGLSFEVAKRKSLAIDVCMARRPKLLHVLATLDDPVGGEMQFSGVPVSEIPINQLPRLVHFLSLSAPFIQGSLRRALTLAVKKRPEDELLLELIEQYQLKNTMDKLGGLDARIWEAGRNLSLDEKFKILIIRAILSKPKYLLLDDPGDQLMPETRELIVQFLEAINTTVIIATQDQKIIDYCENHLCINDYVHQLAPSAV